MSSHVYARESAEEMDRKKREFIRNLTRLDLTGLQEQYKRIRDEAATETNGSLVALNTMAELVEATAKFRYGKGWVRP